MHTSYRSLLFIGMISLSSAIFPQASLSDSLHLPSSKADTPPALSLPQSNTNQTIIIHTQTQDNTIQETGSQSNTTRISPDTKTQQDESTPLSTNGQTATTVLPYDTQTKDPAITPLAQPPARPLNDAQDNAATVPNTHSDNTTTLTNRESKDPANPEQTDSLSLPRENAAQKTGGPKDTRRPLTEEDSLDKPEKIKVQRQVEVVTPTIVPSTPAKPRSLADIVADMKTKKKRKVDENLLDIPDKASKLDFLEGTWRCDFGMTVNRMQDNTEYDAVYEYQFDKKGVGLAYIRTKTAGIEFKGPARASLSNGTLVIDHDNLPGNKAAGRGSAFVGSTLQCQDQGKYAECHMRHKDGSPAREESFRLLRVK